MGVMFSMQPLTLNRADALKFTGISEKLFDALERNGSLVPRQLGRHGQKMYLREQLERATANLFGVGATDIDDEFEDLRGQG